MKHIKQLLLYTFALIILPVIFASTFNVYAQTIAPATNTTLNWPLRVCNSTNCFTSTAVETEVLTTPACMNADMATIKRDVSGPVDYNLPSEFGITSGNYINLLGIAYSGVDNTNLSNHSGFTVNTDLYQSTGVAPSGAAQTLPYWGLGITMTANDPDIAIGTDPIAPHGYNHFALVTYEMADEIYIERFGLSVDQSGIVSMSPEPPGGSTYGCTFIPPNIINCTPIPVPYIFQVIGHVASGGSSGPNSKPHIEIWHKVQAATLTTGVQITSAWFTVTWQKEVSPGVFEVWAMDGSVSGSILNNEYKVADGKMPDVVAVSTATGTGLSGDYRSYITYVDNNDEILYVDECRYGNNTTFGLTKTLATLGSGDKFSTPRISGPMFYDYASPSSADPLCVVAVNDNTGGTDHVNAYKMYHPLVTATVDSLPNVSDYSGTGFTSNIAIMPNISGVGEITSFLAGVPAYSDYAVGFYTDYPYSGNSGDFFAFGVDRAVTNVIPNLPGPGYQQMNFLPLDYSSGTAYSLGTPPAFAMSTANNSGYDMVSAYFLGGTNAAEQQINVAFNASAPYSFKPGRPSAVQVATKAEYATYPNPVTNVLNITQANGAEYTVTNALGQLLNFGTLQGDKAQVGTGSLAAGMYILTISKDGHTEKVKFVKQ